MRKTLFFRVVAAGTIGILLAVRPTPTIAQTLDAQVLSTSPFLKLLPSPVHFYSPLFSPIPTAQSSGIKILKSQNSQPLLSLITPKPQSVTLPTITITPSGDQGFNNWYTGPVTITITATPAADGAEISQTLYSLDNGNTYLPYTEPFQIAIIGTTTVFAKAIAADNSVSPIQSVSVKVNTKAPEFSIFFDPGTKQFDFQGQTSPGLHTAISQSDTDATVQDEAGNRLAMSFQTDSLPHQSTITIKQLQYNDAAPQPIAGSLTVFYLTDTATNQTLPIMQKVVMADDSSIYALYDAKQDITTFEHYAADGSLQTSTTKTGITLVGLTTNQGQITASY